MKKVLLLILIVNILLFSQSVDSLLSENETQTPDQQLELLISELWANRSKNPTYAMQCGRRGILLAKELGEDSKLAKINNMLGVIYRNIGYYTKALEYYNEALDIAEFVGDSVQIAYSYNNIGGAYRLERNYTIALTKMFKALEIFEKLKINEGIAFCTINIGIVYRHQKNYAKALNYFDRTIKIREKLGDKFGSALALNQVIEVYSDEGKLDTAFQNFEDLYKLYESLDDTKGIATVLGSMGGILFKKGDYEQARNYRELALKIHRSINNAEGIVNNLHGLILIYQKLNLLDLAENAIKEARIISKQPGHISFLISHYGIVSNYYENLNNLDSALVYFKRHCVCKDSIAAQESMESIASMEALYQVDLKDRENRILINQNKLKNEQATFLLVLAVLLITLLSFGVFRYYSNKNLNKELKELNATKDKFFSIVAHDLKNPFNNLLGYTELLATDYEGMTEEERKQSIGHLHNSSKKVLALVENLLQWSSANIGSLQYNPRQIIVENEVKELIYLYSGLINKKQLITDTKIEPELVVNIDLDYFKLVMRNLISNAIKFSPPKGEIVISSEETPNSVLIKVKDNGVGISEDKLTELFELGSQKSTKGTMNESGTGLGLILVRDLVKRWGGEILVESKVNVGSTFTIKIPKS